MFINPFKKLTKQEKQNLKYRIMENRVTEKFFIQKFTGYDIDYSQNNSSY